MLGAGVEGQAWAEIPSQGVADIFHQWVVCSLAIWVFALEAWTWEPWRGASAAGSSIFRERPPSFVPSPRAACGESPLLGAPLPMLRAPQLQADNVHHWPRRQTNLPRVLIGSFLHPGRLRGLPRIPCPQWAGEERGFLPSAEGAAHPHGISISAVAGTQSLQVSVACQPRCQRLLLGA